MMGNTHSVANMEKTKNIGLPEGFSLGHYHLLNVLGQGGFGITYLALDQRTNVRVVIKENLPTFYAARDEATLQVRPLAVADAVQSYAHTLQRFVDEARILARLKHPNIVRVQEAFEALGTAYYVMPYIEAKELHKVIPTEAVNEAWLQPILKAVLSALDYLHAKKLLHRDLKPGNILLQADGSPILIDFGTARAPETERSATMVGTPGYTPIEQISIHGKCGAWTDIYSLGATCYRLITGQLPPEANARLAEDVDPYFPLASRAELCTRFSPSLLSSIDKALAIRAKDRWQSARLWLDALAAPAHPVPAYISAAEFKESPSNPKRSHRPLMFALLGICLIGSVGYGLYTCRSAIEQELLLAEYELSEAKRIAKEREEAAKAEAALLAREKAEWEKTQRLMREKAEQEEAERQAREKAMREEAERIAREKAEQEEAERIAREKAEREESDKQAKIIEHYQKGECYLNGSGGYMQSYMEAVSHFRVAAMSGHVKAQRCLAECYYTGRGVALDYDEAAHWFKKAAEQGDSIAQFHLGACYYNGEGVTRDDSMAIYWFRMSANQGNATAEFAMGNCHLVGRGTAQDFHEMVRWYEKSAKQGNMDAQCALGNCYSAGKGVTKDAYAAVYWFKKAAEQGHANAQYYLGNCYSVGRGVEKKRSEADYWYRKAAEQGHKDAIKALNSVK